jgi:hypothetical protein
MDVELSEGIVVEYCELVAVATGLTERAGERFTV